MWIEMTITTPILKLAELGVTMIMLNSNITPHYAVKAAHAS
jgi:hypothetical protein